MNIKYDVKCYPVIPVKICEGGWQLPEVLRSYENCDVTPVTGAIEEVEVYCSGKQQGVNITIDDTIRNIIEEPIIGVPTSLKVVDVIDTNNIFMSNKNTVKWLYNITNRNSNDLRAGTIIASWNNANEIGFTDTSIDDIGDTNDIEFDVTIENNVIKLIIISYANEWLIKINRESLI